MDLTTKLANYALTCQGKADQARRRAEEIRKLPKAGNFPEYDRVHIDAPLTAAEAEAAAWDKRAAEARRGFLLYDPNDMDYCYANDALISECAAASRVVYIEPVAPPGDPLPAQ